MSNAALDGQRAFDWQDLRASGERANAILEELATDTGLLRTLLVHVLDNDRLMSMCERHNPFDKIVLYDGRDRNFRIRLHVWRTTEFERAHQHRFSFTARMLQGRYRHVLYQLPGTIPTSAQQASQHMDPQHPDQSAGVDVSTIRPFLEYDMKAGDSYTLHHDAVHATLVSAQTVSLIVRGPAEKDFAFVANLDEGGVYWRFGRQDESQARIRAKQLSRDDLAAVITDLESRSII